MQRSRARTEDSRSLALVLAASGGFLGLAGVVAGWFRVDIFARSDIFGTQLLQSETFSGLRDMTGAVAFAAGIVVALVVLSMLLFRRRGSDRTATIVAIAGGLVIFAAAIFGSTRTGSVADAASMATTGDRTGTVVFGLWVSATGGLIAAAGGLLARRFSSASG